MVTFSIQNFGMGQTSFEILKKSVARKLEEREIGFCEESGDYRLTVRTDDSLKNDRYIISVSEGGADITAANDPAVHAAVGRLLHLCRFDGRGGFVPAEAGTQVDFTPVKPLRGMYFATHFYNFYHSAPIEKVYEVVEDLALRGCNSILVWFDMHHYDSMQDEAAQKLVQRLRKILLHANAIGMGGSLTMLGNEAFRNSPVELRASWQAIGKYHTAPGDHYRIEICPNKEGGIEKILEYRREMLSYFADLKIDYVVYWPYDQGGCTCEKCQPWGSNGFMKLLPHFERVIKEMMPNTKVIVSTWYFDKFIDGEWDAFYPQMKSELFSDVPYIMSFFFNGKMPECIEKNGIPEGVRFIDFPEISMYSCNPWGGYGASTLPRFLKTTNDICSRLYSGGFPYSEGIFEDSNKFIQMGSYTGVYPNAYDALREYVRFEFCCEDEELFDAVCKTETGLAKKHSRIDGYLHTEIQDTSDVEFVYRVFEKYNRLLPEKIVNSRNFRLFYLRAVIDYEIMKCDGFPIRSERCQEALKEVGRWYYQVPETHRWVSAPFGK